MNKQRTVIITGAAGGLGTAIATQFIKQNDFVYVADLHKDAAEATAMVLGKNAKGIYLDVTDEESVQLVIEQIINERESIEVLVNNAGLQYRAPIESFPLEKWNSLISVMLTGVFLMTKHVFPHMKRERYGRIINISSVHGKLASPEKIAYVAAKHGVLGVTGVTALEGAAFKITANSILPGPVRTELLMRQIQGLRDKGMNDKEALEAIMYPRQAMERFIEPEEVASGVIYLASDSASGITGENISIAGGM
jgi:3-hydroxybutyrate dehydrogenase